MGEEYRGTSFDTLSFNVCVRSDPLCTRAPMPASEKTCGHSASRTIKVTDESLHASFVCPFGGWRLRARAAIQQIFTMLVKKFSVTSRVVEANKTNVG